MGGVVGDYDWYWWHRLVCEPQAMTQCERVREMREHLLRRGRLGVSCFPGADIDAVVSQLRSDGVTVREVRSGVDGYWLEVDGG